MLLFNLKKKKKTKKQLLNINQTGKEREEKEGEMAMQMEKDEAFLRGTKGGINTQRRERASYGILEEKAVTSGHKVHWRPASV